MARSSGPWSRQSLLGTVLAGCGLFSPVEGIVDHDHLLQIHDGRQAGDVDDVLLRDLDPLAVAAALLGIGLVLYRRGQRRTSTAPTQGPHQHHAQNAEAQRES